MFLHHDNVFEKNTMLLQLFVITLLHGFIMDLSCFYKYCPLTHLQKLILAKIYILLHSRKLVFARSQKKSLAKIILVMIARTVLYQNQTTMPKQEA